MLRQSPFCACGPPIALRARPSASRGLAQRVHTRSRALSIRESETVVLAPSNVACHTPCTCVRRLTPTNKSLNTGHAHTHGTNHSVRSPTSPHAALYSLARRAVSLLFVIQSIAGRSRRRGIHLRCSLVVVIVIVKPFHTRRLRLHSRCTIHLIILVLKALHGARRSRLSRRGAPGPTRCTGRSCARQAI